MENDSKRKTREQQEMESPTDQTQSNSERMRKNKRLSLESYLDFLSSNKQLDLNVTSLNQIISMHGFRQIRDSKKVLADAVETIELVDPSRSTLQSDISSSASMSLEQIIADLNRLKWQECCVTSFLTLNSPKQSESTHLSGPEQSEQRPKKKRNTRQKARDISGENSISSAVDMVPVGSSLN